MTNGAFEGNAGFWTGAATGWTTGGGTKWEGEWEAGAHLWTQGMTDIPPGSYCLIKQTISGVVEDGYYLLSAEAKRNTGNGASYLRCSIGADPTGSDNPSHIAWSSRVSDTDWQTLEMITHPIGTQIVIYLRVENLHPSINLPGVWGYFDNVELTRLNKPELEILDITDAQNNKVSIDFIATDLDEDIVNLLGYEYRNESEYYSNFWHIIDQNDISGDKDDLLADGDGEDYSIEWDWSPYLENYDPDYIHFRMQCHDGKLFSDPAEYYGGGYGGIDSPALQEPIAGTPNLIVCGNNSVYVLDNGLSRKYDAKASNSISQKAVARSPNNEFIYIAGVDTNPKVHILLYYLTEFNIIYTGTDITIDSLKNADDIIVSSDGRYVYIVGTQASDGSKKTVIGADVWTLNPSAKTYPSSPEISNSAISHLIWTPETVPRLAITDPYNNRLLIWNLSDNVQIVSINENNLGDMDVYGKVIYIACDNGYVRADFTSGSTPTPTYQEVDTSKTYTDLLLLQIRSAVGFWEVYK